MTSDDPTPSRIVGGGINTGESGQPTVVTQVLGTIVLRPFAKKCCAHAI